MTSRVWILAKWPAGVLASVREAGRGDQTPGSWGAWFLSVSIQQDSYSCYNWARQGEARPKARGPGLRGVYVMLIISKFKSSPGWGALGPFFFLAIPLEPCLQPETQE